MRFSDPGSLSGGETRSVVGAEFLTGFRISGGFAGCGNPILAARQAGTATRSPDPESSRDRRARGCDASGCRSDGRDRQRGPDIEIASALAETQQRFDRSDLPGLARRCQGAERGGPGLQIGVRQRRAFTGGRQEHASICSVSTPSMRRSAIKPEPDQRLVRVCWRRVSRCVAVNFWHGGNVRIMQDKASSLASGLGRDQYLSLHALEHYLGFLKHNPRRDSLSTNSVLETQPTRSRPQS